MSRETMERELVVAADAATVWRHLTDVARVAGWLPILHEVVEREHLAAYDAVLQDKVGPFALKADLSIIVVELVEEQLISVRAKGEDRQVRSQISIDASVRLAPRADGSTDVAVSGTYEITGKVATLGAGTIKSKARKLVDQFCESAAEGLR
jgi:carbon monoxide dehydrogenase subunit G